MIDAVHPAASWFLWIVGLAFLLGSALPLLFVPLRWGRLFGWDVSRADGFTVYLGRCLGGVAVALSLATFRAAPAPAAHLQTLEILLASAALLLLVHIWGALRGGQPWQENAETVMYLGIVVGGTYLYSQLPRPLP